jgi:hypothetical protein
VQSQIGGRELRRFRRPKSRRRKPFVHMGGYFGLSGSADHFVPNCAWWKQFGFGSQALCFFGKAGFKGLGLFETAMLHDITSVLTGPNRRVQHFRSLICTRRAVSSVVDTKRIRTPPTIRTESERNASR